MYDTQLTVLSFLIHLVSKSNESWNYLANKKSKSESKKLIVNKWVCFSSFKEYSYSEVKPLFRKNQGNITKVYI